MTAAYLPPATAGALLVGGDVFTHTSVKGDRPPNLHALVARFLAELAPEQRERYAGRCAEAVLVSDRLHAAEAGKGAPLTAAEARAALWGARLTATRVRQPDDPAHGTYQPPCRSCAALLEWSGIEAVGA